MDYFGERVEFPAASSAVPTSDTTPPTELPRSQKQRLVWSKPLHEKFKMAVKKLGSKAVPKLILNEMNVPGLTREHVASHLQKYRLKKKKKAQQKAERSPRGAASSSDGNNHTPRASMTPRSRLADKLTGSEGSLDSDYDMEHSDDSPVYVEISPRSVSDPEFDVTAQPHTPSPRARARAPSIGSSSHASLTPRERCTNESLSLSYGHSHLHPSSSSSSSSSSLSPSHQQFALLEVSPNLQHPPPAQPQPQPQPQLQPQTYPQIPTQIQSTPTSSPQLPTQVPLSTSVPMLQHHYPVPPLRLDFLVNLPSNTPVTSNLSMLTLSPPQPNEPLFHYSSMPSAGRVNLFVPPTIPSYDLPHQSQQPLFQVDEKTPALEPLFDLGDTTFESFDPLPASTTLQNDVYFYNELEVTPLQTEIFSTGSTATSSSLHTQTIELQSVWADNIF